ncbi:MAG: hypothetical protein DRI61_01080 [Chloroflexi bacterium]|nr:MAG: hypothetical protein DRI61_01080 [Chloroflexota bacterium]
MSRLTIFWIIQAIVFLAFFTEVGFLLSIWLKARIPGLSPETPTFSKLSFLIQQAIGSVFRPQFPKAVRGLVLDGVFHRRLFHTNFLRWLGHIMAFGAFLLLGIFSTLTGFASEILHHLFGVKHPLIIVFTLPDHPLIALINEVLGMIILVGLCILFYRRFIAKDPQLRTAFDDKFVISLLLIIVLSGFLLEAVRLLGEGARGVAPALGFLGYALHRLLAFLPLPWHGVYLALFFFHFGLCDLLLLYLPFSKFAHILASPLLVLLNAFESQSQSLEVTG